MSRCRERWRAAVGKSPLDTASGADFPFSIFRLSFIIAGAPPGVLSYVTNVIWKMENETTKIPQSVVHSSADAARHLARPAILPGNEVLFDTEIFPAKRDLPRHAIQRELAFDRQRRVYSSWRPRRSVLER